MKAKQHSEISPMGFGVSLIIGGIALAALFVTTSLAIPWFTERYAIEPIISWFICVSTIVFLPMLLATYILVRVEQKHFTWKSFLTRIRYKTLKSEDWLWVGFGIILILITTGFLAYILKGLFHNLTIQPSFLEMPRITSDNRWILLAWLPMFFLNIVGEEFFWRGYIFPKQLKVFGKYTWFYNGVVWLLFHIPFGLNLMIILLPTLFITTFTFQKTNNVKVPIAIHGIINGAGFLVIAFGYI
jgi:membrane protease YdiL (CAAX protease family)